MSDSGRRLTNRLITSTSVLGSITEEVGMKKRIAVILLLGTLFLLTGYAPRLWSQAVASAQISGSVQDPSGAAVPGAKVVATQTNTKLARTTASGPDGSLSATESPGWTVYAGSPSKRFPKLCSNWNHSSGQRQSHHQRQTASGTGYPASRGQRRRQYGANPDDCGFPGHR